MAKKSSIAYVVLLASVFPGPTSVRSEEDLLTCTLRRSGSEFKGACSIPCRVNTLAVNVDGADRKFI